MPSDIEKLLNSVGKLPPLAEEPTPSTHPQLAFTTLEVEYLIGCLDLGINTIMSEVRSFDPEAFFRIIKSLVNTRQKLESVLPPNLPQGDPS